MTTSRRWIVLFVLIAAGLAALQLSSTPQVVEVLGLADSSVAAVDEGLGGAGTIVADTPTEAISDCTGNSQGDILRELKDWAAGQSGSPKPSPTAVVGGNTCGANLIAWYRDYDDDTYTRADLSCCISCGVSSSPTSTACLTALGTKQAGFRPASTSADCDDELTTINPGINELTVSLAADRVDQDCNGLDTCFQDLDGDGAGTTTVVVPPLNTPLTGPGGVSGCQGATGVSERSDDNCPNTAAALNPRRWRADCDLDGSQGPLIATACDAPATPTFPPADYPNGCPSKTLFTESGGPYDCADGDAGRTPGRSEVTGDGIDQNCNNADQCYVDLDNDGSGGTSGAIAEPTSSGTLLLCGPAANYSVNKDDQCDTEPARTTPATWRADCDGDDAYTLTSAFECTEAAARGILSVPGPCTVSPGITTAADCDDSDDDVSPLLDEIALGFAGNRVDEDCDELDACFVDEDDDGVGSSVVVNPPDGTPLEVGGGSTCRALPQLAEVSGDSCDTTAGVSAPQSWKADCDEDGGYGAARVTACTDALAFPTCDVVLLAALDRDLDCADSDASTLGNPIWLADCDGDGKVGQDPVEACSVSEARTVFRAKRTDCTGNSFVVVRVGVTSGYVEECDDKDKGDTSEPELWRADCDNDGLTAIDTPAVEVCSAEEAVARIVGTRPGCDIPGDIIVKRATPTDPFDCNDSSPGIGASKKIVGDCDGDGTFFGTDTVQACSASEAVDGFKAIPACTYASNPAFQVRESGTSYPVDCDDYNISYSVNQAWYADCDADSFRATAARSSCTPTTAVASFMSAFPACTGLTTSRVSVTFPPNPDCDDANDQHFPGQVWRADCDRDSEFGAQTYAACGPSDAQAVFSSYCKGVLNTAPLQTVVPIAVPADTTLTVRTVAASSADDCWDGLSTWKSTAVWRADCDRDGVFGVETHQSCGANIAYLALCSGEGVNDCLVADPSPNTYPYMTTGSPSFTDCDDLECTVRPGSTRSDPGRDWNCDGTVLCYTDQDGDGYGKSPAAAVTGQTAGISCTSLSGFAELGSDCKDDDVTFNPAANDIVADDFDQDCDGYVMCWYDPDEDNFGGGSTGCADPVVPPDTAEPNTIPGYGWVPAGLTCKSYAEDYFVPVATVGGDCDNCDENEFPGQKWHADCDGDGPVREETFEACGSADALLRKVCSGGTEPAHVAFDGGVVGQFDCLDDDSARFPGSGETCGTPGVACERCEIDDQLDDDCNGDFNTAGPTGAIGAIPAVGGFLLDAYLDADGDGFGSSQLSGARRVCEVKEGLSANSLDCDDSDDKTRPGAPEICDFKDQNCNDVTDEAEAIDPENTAEAACIVLYRDLDEDGAGDPLVSQCVCAEPRRPSALYVPKDDTNADPLDTINDVDPLQGRFANARYVGPPTDCDDAHADIKPHECNDGIDNDGDGLIDGRDAGCLVGAADGRRSASEANRAATQVRDPSAVVVVLERIDGHDNECDGAVPIIELDCDDDGSLPWLGTSYETPFETSVALGLQPCDPDQALTLSCWGEELDVACDEITGLWTTRYGQSDDGFGGRYAGGYRMFAETTCDRFGDCDDGCASRCPGQDEACDGVDNDCSLVTTAPVEGLVDTVAGVPGALETAFGALSPAGTVVPAELDFDGDGAAACTEDFLDGDAEVHEAPLTCVGFAEDFPKTDCDDLCYAANSASTEVCNGFVDVCGAAPADREGVDADDDGRQTCGAYAPDDAILDEIVAVPVWVDCSSADRGGPALQDACASVVVPDGADELGVVPLVAARVGGEDCDAPLTAAQQALAARIEDAGFATWSADADLTASALVAAACAVGEGLPAGARIGGLCTVVEITLLRDDELLAADESTGAKLEPACEEVPEQHSVRTTWTRARILEARQGVVELECLRAFGLPCASIVDDTPRLALGAPVNVDVLFDPEVATGDTDGVVTQPVPWWLELGRFAPHSAAGMLMTCWGDPRVETIATRTGGDCDDGTTEAHRDLPEGPHDLVLAFEGINGDCARCVDGIDNNCDSRTDCEDPTCAVCFVGQGQGCAGARDACSAPAEGGGCSTGMAGGVAVFTALPLLLLSAGRRRRDPAR